MTDIDRLPSLQAMLVALEDAACFAYLNGEIIAMNQAFEAMFGTASGSVFESLDPLLLQYAIAQVSQPAAHPDDITQPEHFASTTPSGRLVRVLVTPVLATSNRHQHVLITCKPLDTNVAWTSREGQFLQQFTEGVRAPLASIRAAIETMVSYPEMDATVAQQFKSIILEQATGLSGHLEDALARYADTFKSTWPLETMSGTVFLKRLQAHFNTHVDTPLRLSGLDTPIRLRIDSFALRHALAFLAQLIRNATHCEQFTCRLQRINTFAALDIAWRGASIRLSRLQNWETQPISLADTIVTTTLQEILARHRAEILTGNDEHFSYVRVLLIPT